MCIIIVGDGNDYGHPYPEVLSRLQESGCTIYQTDEEGTIVVSTDGEGYQIEE